jgi:membrane fusion protein, multidrug efflux system
MKKALVPVLILLAAALIAYWLFLRGDGNSGGPGGPPGGFGGMGGGALVVLEPVNYERLANEIEAIGTIRALESVVLTAKVSDTISALHFDDGDLVEAGTVLVELTNREEQALLAEAQANLADGRRQLRRFEELVQQGSVPVSQVDEARSRVEGQEARLEALLARLDDRLIRAPFDGVLGFREVSPGTLVSPGTAITTIDDISTVRLDFSVPEVFLGALASGQRVIARSAAYPGEQFEGEISSIGTRVDPISRAATVRARLPNDGLRLRPGMLMTLRLVTAEREALVVPERAVTQIDTRAFVYVSANGVAEQRTVRLGDRQRGMVEILDGLAAGEEIVTDGVIRVRPGARLMTEADMAGRGGPGSGRPGGGPLGRPGGS